MENEKNKVAFPKKEIQDWASNLGQAAKEKVADVAVAVKQKRENAIEISTEKRLKKERDQLQPVFLSDLSAAGFRLPPMICIEDPDEKHMRSLVCKDAIGFQSNEGDLQILHLYPDAVDKAGIHFFPQNDKAAYFVDNSKSSFYVNLEDYFKFQRKARIDELEQIAFCLGATHVEARLIEQESSKETTKRKAGINAAKVAKAGMEHDEERREYTKSEVALCSDFVGNNEPKRPVLHYFNNEDNILNLIDMRLHGENSITAKSYSWEFSHSSGIQEKTAVKIESALKKMKYGLNTSLVNKASEEKRTMLKYTIKFKAEKEEQPKEKM